MILVMISLTVSVHKVQVPIYLVCNHAHVTKVCISKCKQLTHRGLQLALCCLVITLNGTKC